MVLCLLLGHFVINLGKLNPTNPSWRICLVQHVFPEFSSPAGHLRAKVLVTAFGCLDPLFIRFC
ncbi:hypothetical protein YC2023_078420 [Brassica napus]